MNPKAPELYLHLRQMKLVRNGGYHISRDFVVYTGHLE